MAIRACTLSPTRFCGSQTLQELVGDDSRTAQVLLVHAFQNTHDVRREWLEASLLLDGMVANGV